MSTCTKPARGTRDGGATSPMPFDPDINDDPCGKPEYKDNLCLGHWRLTYGDSSPEPASEGALQVSIYSDDFATVRWDATTQAANPDLDITDGSHAVTLELRAGTAIEDILNAVSSSSWFDDAGKIGKVKRGGSEVPKEDLAALIESGEVIVVSVDASVADHPDLVIA